MSRFPDRSWLFGQIIIGKREKQRESHLLSQFFFVWLDQHFDFFEID
jgi:hypothetical protein